MVLLVGRRRNPIDLLCACLCIQCMCALVQSSEAPLLLSECHFFCPKSSLHSLSAHPLFPFLSLSILSICIFHQIQTSTVTPGVFCLYVRCSSSSSSSYHFTISYCANLGPTHTPWSKQLVKGQAV